MKRSLTLGLIAAAAAAFLSGAIIVSAEVTNGGFETGDTSGWTTDIPAGGFVEVVTDALGNDPVEGDFFALLKTDGPGSSTALFQTVTVPAGGEVSGSAIFMSGEAEDETNFCDLAAVEILVDSEVASTPFSADACDGGSTNWTAWSFTVPGDACEEVEVTIRASVENDDDSAVDSLMGLDNVEADDACEGAQITISKETVGFLSQEFEFETDFGESFSLSHGESVTFSVDPGEYEITEKPEASFTLHSVVCTGDGDDDAITNGVEIDVDEGDVIECTFRNARPNVSGAIVISPPPAAVTQPQQTSAAPAPSQAPAISPPSTGDAGLR